MFRLLKANEIDVRVQTVKDNGLVLLLYKDARVDQNILDETIGAMNWKREHTRDNANCIVSIWNDDIKQWISKEDTGTESNTEKEKGQASDSFKRACFNWGIGRELYSSPFIWINNKNCTIENKKCYDKFEVVKIGYDDNKEINELQIKNINLSRVVFDMKAPNVPELESKEDKKLKAEIEDTKNKPVTKERIEMLIKEVESRGITDGQLLEVLSRYNFHSTNDIKTNEELTKVWQDLVKIKKVGGLV